MSIAELDPDVDGIYLNPILSIWIPNYKDYKGTWQLGKNI